MPKTLKKNEMPVQDPAVRAKNFDEVALGYTVELAKAEAERCFHCKKPRCREGCPVSVNIPDFIAHIKDGDFDGALSVIKESNALPAVCGRVCPQENQCEKNCIAGIKGEPVAIGRLERFVADRALRSGHHEKKEPPKGAKKVAVIGAGPSGLSCAGELAQRGYDVTIFEALHKAGGVLSYGIPEFRLPKDDIVEKEIQSIKDLGVKIELDSVVGRLYTVDELMDEEGFSAVFIGTGAGLPRFQNIPGENLSGVYSANEFLTRCNLMKSYEFPTYTTPMNIGRRVAVVGGGNVAMDAARTALRLGADSVTVVYRRSEAEIPARAEEVGHAKEEGIRFHFLTNPVEVLGDDKGAVRALKLQEMELGEPDASGRRRPMPVEGAYTEEPVDTVIIAIGTSPNPILTQATDIELNKRGNIVADEETGATSKKGVFAGGDIVTGAATVILAMGAGRKAAAGIDAYLQRED